MHPLLQQVRAVGRRARGILMLRGLAWWACWIILAALIAALADFWFRFGEQGVRWLASGSVIAVAVWSGWRFVWPAIRLRTDEETIAEWIEGWFPDLRDRLTSAVSFLRQPRADPRYGSDSLRENHVRETTSAVAKRNLLECVDGRSARRPVVALVIAIVATVTICISDLHSATVAARRLAMPWVRETWPRRTWLKFTNRVGTLAAGQDFVAEVEAERGWLPSEVTILYWFEGDKESEARPYRMTFSGGKMTHRLPQVTRPFRYRAYGGDHVDMPWTRLRVVEPVRVVDTKFVLHPPPYTRLMPYETDRSIQALEGTTVEVTGKLTKPVRAAELHFKRDSGVRRIAGAVSSDGLSFTLPGNANSPWSLQESGMYGWRVVDRVGVANTVELNSRIDVQADARPAVAIEFPAPGAAFLNTATIPLKIVAKDDLAVHRIAVTVGKNTIEIEAPSPADSIAWPPRGDQQSFDVPLALADIPDLQPGASISIRVTARDFKPQESAPAEITINIISPEELKVRLDQRQALILQRLNESLRLQRTVRSQTKSLEQSGGSEDPETARTAGLAAVELNQRHVRDYLAGDRGALRLIEESRSDIANNQLNDVQLATQLDELHREVSRIAHELLPPIETIIRERLTVSRGSASAGSTTKASNDGQLAGSLSQAVAGQDRVIEALEALVDQLSQWSGYRLLAQEVAQIQFDQQTLLGETRTLPTAARNFNQLSAEEQTVLERLAQRQADLAAQLARLEVRIEQLHRQFAERDLLAAATLSSALEVLRESFLTSQMRNATRELSQNLVGSATATEQQIIRDLQRLQDALTQRGERDLARVAEQLEKASEELKGVAERQAAAAELARKSREMPDNEQRQALKQLAQEEQELSATTDQISQRLKQMSSESAAHLPKVTEAMTAAENAAKANDAESAEANALKAAELLNSARQTLERDLATARKQQSHAEQQALGHTVQSLHSRQQGLLDLTRELGKDADENEPLPEDKREEALRLAELQRELATQAKEAAEKFSSAAVFSQTLNRASEAMDRASQRLADRWTNQQTVELQIDATRRLERLLTALGNAPSSSPTADQQPAENDSPPQDTSGPSIAELRVLRDWQLEINKRTSELAKRQPTDGTPFTDEQLAELAALAAEQNQIAELLERLGGDNTNESKENLDRRPPDAPPDSADPTDALDRALQKSGIPGFDQ